MPTAATLEVLIKARDEVSGAFQKISGRAGGLGRRFGALGGMAARAGKALALVGAAAGVAAIAIGVKAFNAAVDLETQMQKVNTVFGDSLGVVEDWSKQAAAGMGVSQQRAQQMAASIGDILKPLGFAEKEAAKFGTEATDMAAALAFFNSVPTEQAANAVQSALVGEREALKTLGVVISEADVQARLAAKGQAGLTGEAMKQAKALATLELIQEGSTDAQRAYAEANETARGKINELKSTLFTLRDNALQRLIPVVGKIAGAMSENIPKAIDAVQGAFRSLTAESGALNKFATQIALGLGIEKGSKDLAGFGSTVQAIFRELGNRALPILQEVGRGFLDFGRELLEIAREVGPSVLRALMRLGRTISRVAPDILNIAQNVSEFVLQLVTFVSKSGAIQIGVEGLSRAIEELAPLVTGVLSFLSDNKPVLAGVAAAIITAMVPAIIAWTTAQVALTAAQIAGAAAFVAANAPLIAIVAGIGLLVAAIVLLIQNWDTVKEKTVAVWNGIKDFLLGNWQEIVSIASLILLGPAGLVVLFTTNAFGIRDKVTGAFTSLKDNVAEKLGLLPGIVADAFRLVRNKVLEWLGWPSGLVWSGILTLPGHMFSFGKDLIEGLIQGILTAAVGLFNEIKGVGEGAFNALKDGLGKLDPRSPSEYGIEVGEGLGLGIEAGVQNTLARVRDAINRVAATVQVGLSSLITGREPTDIAADKLRSFQAVRDIIGARSPEALQAFNREILQRGRSLADVLDRGIFPEGRRGGSLLGESLRDLLERELPRRGFRLLEDDSVKPVNIYGNVIINGDPQEGLAALGLS